MEIKNNKFEDFVVYIDKVGGAWELKLPDGTLVREMDRDDAYAAIQKWAKRVHKTVKVVDLDRSTRYIVDSHGNIDDLDDVTVEASYDSASVSDNIPVMTDARLKSSFHKFEDFVVYVDKVGGAWELKLPDGTLVREMDRDDAYAAIQKWAKRVHKTVKVVDLDRSTRYIVDSHGNIDDLDDVTVEASYDSASVSDNIPVMTDARLKSSFHKITEKYTKDIYNDKVSWGPLHRMIKELQGVLPNLGLFSTDHDKSSPPKYKKWTYLGGFKDSNGRNRVVLCHVVINGAGSVEDPLGRFDIVVNTNVIAPSSLLDEDQRKAAESIFSPESTSSDEKRAADDVSNPKTFLDPLKDSDKSIDFYTAVRQMMNEGLVSRLGDARKLAEAGITPEFLRSIRRQNRGGLRMRRDYGKGRESSENGADDTKKVLEALKDYPNLIEALGTVIDIAKTRSRDYIVGVVAANIYETLRNKGYSREIDKRAASEKAPSVLSTVKILDAIADRLEMHGLREAAEKIDVVSNTLEAMEVVPDMRKYFDLKNLDYDECPKCKGTGKSDESRVCPKCGGMGVVIPSMDQKGSKGLHKYAAGDEPEVSGSGAEMFWKKHGEEIKKIAQRDGYRISRVYTHETSESVISMTIEAKAFYLNSLNEIRNISKSYGMVIYPENETKITLAFSNNT